MKCWAGSAKSIKNMQQPASNDTEIWLSEPQTAVLSSRAQVILNMSGQGGGKSKTIAYSSGMFISDFPQALGFIGANTHMQLSQSTLVRVFATWKETYGFTEFDPKSNPGGAYVVDKKPPAHFRRIHHLRDYAGTISFYNGTMVFIGSLENYKAHDGKEFAWAHLDETKDTDENALKDVILGRLRQYGVWYNQAGDVLYNSEVTPEQAKAEGWTAWNPLYIHTSPPDRGGKWLIDMFKLNTFQKEIKTRVQRKEKDYFHKEFENKAVIIYSAHHNAHNMPPNYIANQEANLIDEDKILKLVYGYPFGKSGGEWFPTFRRDIHVKKDIPFFPQVPVHISWDFNVVPYMTLVCAQIDFVTRYLDAVGNKHPEPAIGYKPLDVMRIRFYREYCLKAPQNSTEAVCIQFAQDHDPLTCQVMYYGDATGLNRIPGMGSVTNYKIVEDNLYVYLHNESKQVKNPNVRPLTRRDLLNKIFAGLIPEVEIEIDEDGCPELVNDCENVKLGPKGKAKSNIKDPVTGEIYQEHGHPTDAMECLVSEVCKHFIISQ
jgi:hypothetical protein